MKSHITSATDRSIGSTLALLTTAFVVLSSVSEAATTLAVTGTPTPGANDISQLVVNTAGGWSGINLAGNNYPVGNTFFTGTNGGGYTFNSLSVSVLGPGNAAAGTTFRMNLYSLNIGETVTATSIFSSGTVTLGSTPVAGDYLTFTSNDAFTLSANTAYAFTLTSTSGSGITFGYSNNDHYADGTVVRIFDNGSVEYGFGAFDMAFNLGLTAIPEPTAIGLAAIGGLSFLRRKRN